MVHQIRQITILRFKSIFLPLIFLFDKSFLLVKRAKGLNLKGKNGEALWVESLDFRKKFAPPISGHF